MADAINGIAVYLVPGMQIKIKAPVYGRNQQGFFARLDKVPDSYFEDASNAQTTPERGFCVENTTVGTIIADPDEEAASVIYTHKQPYPNAIWFFARTGERGLVKVISVPVHDHSTIVHGGPAYGTYFDDDIER